MVNISSCLKDPKRGKRRGSELSEYMGKMLGTCYFRVLSLLTKRPLTLGSTFSIPPMTGAMKAWEFFWEHHKKLAVFDVKALVVPECSTWKLNTCGLLEAFLRALGPKGGSDQGENKSDHFPFTENAEFPDITSVYHALKMRARLHI